MARGNSGRVRGGPDLGGVEKAPKIREGGGRLVLAGEERGCRASGTMCRGCGEPLKIGSRTKAAGGGLCHASGRCKADAEELLRSLVKEADDARKEAEAFAKEVEALAGGTSGGGFGTPKRRGAKVGDG